LKCENKEIWNEILSKNKEIKNKERVIFNEESPIEDITSGK